MMWETKTFEELYLEPSRNGIYKPKEFHGSGCKIVNMGELFAYDFVGQQDMKRVELNEKELERDTLKDGDILFGRRSLVESGAGKSSIVKNLNEPTTYESSIIRLRLNKKHSNPYFYYYWLLSPSGKGGIASIVTGANVKGIKSSDLKNIVVPAPPLPIQNKIVGILSAYDDLIENNLKRIKLLEEIAQITYEEWFVSLRFPGYESTPINHETGLPEGWTIEPLGKHLKFVKGKKVDELFTEYDEGLVRIMLLDSLESGNFKFTTPDKHVSTKRGDLVMCMDGARSSYVFYAEDGIVGSTMAKIEANSLPVSLLYLFFESILESLQTNNTGAAIPHANKAFINSIELPIPSIPVLQKWDSAVSKLNSQVWNLRDQNQRLREARDILLPRLMTGVIDAESYDPAQLLKEAA